MHKASPVTGGATVGMGRLEDHPETSAMTRATNETDTEVIATSGLHPVIERFRNLIEGDPDLSKLFPKMFEQIPDQPPYTTDPSGAPQGRDYNTMLTALDAIIRRAPTFNAANPTSALNGLPIAYILQWPMGTPAGYEIFMHRDVNDQLREILTEWARFLASPESTYVLTSDEATGWFSPIAMATTPNFEADFVCDPSDPHHGFKSWDDFFTRRYRPDVRPIASPNDNSIIIDACEAAPFRLPHGVQLREAFWLKGQPYSLQDMLAVHSVYSQFEGGTVYQANLGSLNYHRWHSPVAGTVIKAYHVPGSYYSENLAEGFDAEGPNRSLAFITHVATRAVVYIQADNPLIGPLCFLAVGIQEVSSCEVQVGEGQHLIKGEEMGMFHYGGSTYCLILSPGTDVEFDLHGETPGLEAGNVRVCDVIATVKKK